jgi:hypothetical protein
MTIEGYPMRNTVLVGANEEENNIKIKKIIIKMKKKIILIKIKKIIIKMKKKKKKKILKIIIKKDF